MNDAHCRVLLIEDNPGDAELMSKALLAADPPFEVFAADSLSSGLDAVHDNGFDVVLTDLSLPDSQGLDTVRQLRRHAQHLPMIVLTSLSSNKTALQALDAGAQDYLVKDHVSAETLQRSIRYAIQRRKNIEMRELIGQLQSNEALLEKKNMRLETLYKTAHRFVDNVSHEFRTPLTVIKEYVSLMREGVVGELDDEQKRMLDVVCDRADDLNNMVDDMLDISKLEAGMLSVWRKNCRVEEIVQHVRPNLEKKSTIKEVELIVEIPDNLPEIYCDEEKAGRTIVNLTTNALKFCGQPGKVRLWATLNEEEGEVVIGVTDNGPGISSENLEAIFKRFKQLGENPRGSTKGFGLGLNIAKELVDLNLGIIHVESEIGQGSTFSFTLPIAEPLLVVRRYVDKIKHMLDGINSVMMVEASIADSSTSWGAEAVHVFLNQQLRHTDLIIRNEVRRWLIILAMRETDLPKFFDRLEKAWREANQNRPDGQLPFIHKAPFGSWRFEDDQSELIRLIEDAMQEKEKVVLYA